LRKRDKLRYDPRGKRRPYNDGTCVIEGEQKEHPRISRSSCVCFGGFRDAQGTAGPIDIDCLEERLNLVSYEVVEDASSELLEKMRVGCAKSEFAPYRCKHILQKQNLVA
jgi:hypothetical protein